MIKKFSNELQNKFHITYYNARIYSDMYSDITIYDENNKLLTVVTCMKNSYLEQYDKRIVFSYVFGV
jgi:hypothetical protein